ncbi:MAG: hypothetical protein HN929_01855 [Chloroflexi bacterium]|jgi:hypothetical protein|nr:hypothetical protein [Chloroflexota bacterium]MBT7080205.1 hypothetical protein [Chloroflexota bacterium]MBT7290151.1 hypothetical protein [Chloroflexota bacterium]
MPSIKCPYCGNDAPVEEYGDPAYCPACGRAPQEHKPLLHKRSINNLSPQAIAKMVWISRVGAIVLITAIVIWYIFARLFYVYPYDSWQAYLFSSVLSSGALNIVIALAVLMAISWRWRFLGGLLAVSLGGPRLLGYIISFIRNAGETSTSNWDRYLIASLVGTTLWILILAFGVFTIIVGIWQRRQPDFKPDSGLERRISGYPPKKIRIMKWSGRVILTLFWLLAIAGEIRWYTYYETSFAPLPLFDAILSILFYSAYIGITWKWPLVGGAIALGWVLRDLLSSLIITTMYNASYADFEAIDFLLLFLEPAVVFTGGVLIIIVGWRKLRPGQSSTSV